MLGFILGVCKLLHLTIRKLDICCTYACIVTCLIVVQGDRRPLLAENGSINAQQEEVEMKKEEGEEVRRVIDVFLWRT